MDRKLRRKPQVKLIKEQVENGTRIQRDQPRLIQKSDLKNLVTETKEKVYRTPTDRKSRFLSFTFTKICE